MVLEDQGEPEDGCGEEEGVDAIEDAAVSGEHGSGVFDTGSTLDGGFEEVAQLSCDVQDRGEQEGLPDGLGDVEEKVAAGGEEIADPDDETGGEEASGDGGDGALPGLAGAEARGQFVFAEGLAYVEGGDVSGPDADHEEEDEGGAVLLLPEEGNEGEGVGDPDEAEEPLGGIGQDLDEGRTEAVPGEEDESEGAEDGELLVDGEVGQGDDEGEGGAEGHPPEGDAKFGSMGLGANCGELEVLVAGQLGHDGGEEGYHPKLAEEDEGEDGGDQD
ncbi:MAG: hypothetical protein JWP98_1014 [Edaphobacter sp.]|nr:hypothetical protein [Edaphobacter sp.]